MPAASPRVFQGSLLYQGDAVCRPGLGVHSVEERENQAPGLNCAGPGPPAKVL